MLSVDSTYRDFQHHLASLANPQGCGKPCEEVASSPIAEVRPLGMSRGMFDEDSGLAEIRPLGLGACVNHEGEELETLEPVAETDELQASSSCETMCLKLSSCTGFVFAETTGTCHLIS